MPIREEPESSGPPVSAIADMSLAPSTDFAAGATQLAHVSEEHAIDEEHGDDDRSTQGEDFVEPAVGEASKKKRKRKPKSKRGLNAPTGFEEYYVDAPLTPQEFEVERGLYHPSRTFSDRIQTAIQRYHAKRQMDPIRSEVFDKYLAYGGVDVSPNMFTGVDFNAFQDMDAKEILEATSTAQVGSDKGKIGMDGSKWVVDFEGCVKGSSRLPLQFDLATEETVKSHCNTIRNFLNYLLHHEVAPESTNDIYAARDVCDLAATELWQIQEAGRWLPGDFNIACSTIFKGSHHGTYSPNYKKWLPDAAGLVGMSNAVAKQVVMFGLAAAGSTEQAAKFHELDKEGKIEQIDILETGFEVTEVKFADRETRLFYKEQSADFRTLGRLKAKPWQSPTQPLVDMTEEEEAALLAARSALMETPAQQVEYEFFVEDATLRYIYPGMKLEAKIRELNCGLRYFDSVIAIHPSFYTFLPNEMMLEWKRGGANAGGGDESDGDGN